MRIGIIHPHTTLGTGTPPDDALAVVIWESSRRLAETDEVTVFGRRAGGQPAREVLEGVRLRRFRGLPDQLVGQIARLDGVVFRDPLRPFRTTSLYYRGYRRGVETELRAAPYDVLHVHVVPNFLPAFREAAPGARIAFHAHDHHVADFDPDVMSRLLAPADVIFACSRFVSDRIASRLPALADRCEVLYNGVDQAFLDEPSPNPEGDGPRILFVGRLSPEKGVHVLVDAFVTLADRFPGATLDLVGPGDLAPLQFVDPFESDPLFEGLRGFNAAPRTYAAFLENRIPSHLRARIRFLGSIPHARLPEVYRSADLFAFPSIWHEPFGMPVIEAMAVGLPVVAARSGAIPETVRDGETGVLADRGDVAGLADALAGLLDSPERRHILGDAGHRRVLEMFTWDGIAAAQRDRYTELIGVRGRAPAGREE